ncbi:MAG: protein translocase subunit SecD [Acidimicrobiales bacterium]
MRSKPLVWSLSLILLIAVVSVGATLLTGKAPLLGLDLKGGVSVVEQPHGKVTPNTLTEAQSIINARVNGLGVSNSNVTVQGKDIVIELPGAKDDTQVLNVVGETARLYFRPMVCEIPPYAPPTSTTTPTSRPQTSKATPSRTTPTTPPPKKAAAGASVPASGPLAGLDAQLASDTRPLAAGPTTTTATAPSTTTTTTPLGTSICNMSGAQQQSYLPPHGDKFGLTPALWDTKGATVVLPFYSDYNSKGHYVPNARYVLGPAQMTGSIVKTATANFSASNNQWEVDLTFTGKGSTEFNNYAASYYQCYKQDPKNPPYCARQAIELDAQVESAPSLQSDNFNGAASITGTFTSAQANALANALNYGSLPVTFKAQSISNVSPEIGTDSLKAGAVAGGIAVLLVILYLLVYYRALGLVVVIGICMSGALLYAITTLLSYTEGLALTLSGVIGLIVSVGVTADSCVVYFERLKEEIRSGRTVRTSVEKGFGRAFRTILAADFSSFIAALILYVLTVGDVRGFAFFLGLATLLNVVTTYFFTRPLVILLGRRAGLGRGGLLGVGRGLGVSGTAQ